jgi:predicted metal-dependent enzyme (double-stranded beta helix superfamily)
MTDSAGAIFARFITDVRTVWAAEADTERRINKTRPLLEGLVSNEVIQAKTREWPSTEGRGNLLLYTDKDYGFVVNAVVRDPHRKGNVHDHAQAWVLYGVVEGSEFLERYERLDDGSRPGFAEIRQTSVTTGRAGLVDVVAPLAIHAEQGGPTRSVAIIFRSEVLVGRVMQHGYDLKAKTVTERSGPPQIPYDFV